MPKVQADQELPRAPAAPQHNGVRDAGDANRVRSAAEPAADGDHGDEAVRTAAASRGQAERAERLDRVRAELAGTARAPGRAHSQPAADARVLLSRLATLLTGN